MKIDISLQIKSLRGMKGVMQTLQKVFNENKEKVNIYLIYFASMKQIRFLVSSEHCMAIIAIDPRITIQDKSVTKEKTQMLAIEFKGADLFLDTFCEIVQKESMGDVTITISRDKPSSENAEPFRSLNFINLNDKFRIEISKPYYDPPVILNHSWLNGCSSAQQKKVEFDIQSEQILSLLRLIYRQKQSQAKERAILVSFNFLDNSIVARLQKLKHNSKGQIFDPQFTEKKYQGNYHYTILPEHTGRVYEFLLGKSSGRKMFINVDNNLVFSYYQEGVFESQILVKQWIKFSGFASKMPRHPETKMEMP